MPNRPVRDIVLRVASPVRAVMRYCSIASMVLLTVVALIIFYDVLSRKLIDQPIFGVPEITEMTMLFVCFLSIGYIANRRLEIEIDFFNPKLSPLGERVMLSVRLLACLFIVGLIVWQSFVQGIQVMRTDEISSSLRMPLWPFYFVVTFGASLYCLEMIFQLLLGPEDDPGSKDEQLDLLS